LIQKNHVLGFSDSVVQVTVPVSLNIGTSQVKTTSQQVTVSLSNVAIGDRRSNFVPYSTTLAISDLIQGNQRISKNKVSINFGSPVNETGSDLSQTTSSPGSLSTTRTVLSNTSNNAGGKFVYSPQITVTIIAYAKLRTYTATITLSVS